MAKTSVPKRKKIDWNQLKVEFLRGPYKNLKEFAEDKGMNIGTIRNRCSGWAQEKETYYAAVTEQAAIQCTFDEDVRSAAEMNVNHVRLWDKFLTVIQEAFYDYDSLHTKDGGVKAAQLERLAGVMERAQKGQRLALNMDRETGNAKGMLAEISEAIREAKDHFDAPES